MNLNSACDYVWENVIFPLYYSMNFSFDITSYKFNIHSHLDIKQ